LELDNKVEILLSEGFDVMIFGWFFFFSYDISIILLCISPKKCQPLMYVLKSFTALFNKEI